MTQPIPLIAVIGIGRTLSSALCESLRMMGASFGTREIRGEHVALARYLEGLHPFPKLATQCLYERDVYSDLAEIIRRIALECGTATPAIKYPTLCWHLDDLAAAWTAGPIRWIHIDRHLEDSIRSLIDRSTPRRSSPRLQANADECRRMQQSLWLAKEAWFRNGPPHLHIWAEDLMDDPAREFARVAEFLEWDVPAVKLANAAAHINRDLATRRAPSRHTPPI